MIPASVETSSPCFALASRISCAAFSRRCTPCQFDCLHKWFLPGKHLVLAVNEVFRKFPRQKQEIFHHRPPCGIGFQGFTWQAGGPCHDKRDACADGVDTKAMLAGPWVQSRDACADASRRWRLPGMGHQLWPSIGKQKMGANLLHFYCMNLDTI